MNINKTYKIIAFFTLTVEFVIFFVLFGKIRNITLDYNISENLQFLYLLLILALAFIVILFTLSILGTYKKESKEKYDQKDTILFDNSIKKVSNEEKSEEDLLDAEHYIKKILPKQDSNLDLTKFSEKLLSNIAKEFDIVQGLLFLKDKKSNTFEITGKYAYFGDEEPKSFNLGETLSGQVAKNKKTLILKEIPENYVTILSGLGSSSPNHVIIIPVIVEDKTTAIIELASFKEFKQTFNNLFDGMSEQIGKALMKY
ncbi:GAF domain-containing protein [Bacteroidota bacterium]